MVQIAGQVDPHLIVALEGIVGARGVLWSDYDLRLYEYDASIDRHRPQAVVFPTSAEQVAAIVRLCQARRLPFTARGAGTGLSGGAIPASGGVLISLARMNRVLELDLDNLRAVVEPGLVNLRLSQMVAPHGLTYIPDPSSQKACTIGGNVGENSGGPHTLRYGVTTNHVLGLEVVLPDGRIITTGGKAGEHPGYDLTGLLVGSEGTLGIVTKVVARLVPLPEAVKTFLAAFPSVRSASEAVAGIIARGLVPAALEMMDGLTIQAVEQATRAGYPADAQAVLLIEVEGLREEMEPMAEAVMAVCQENGALQIRVAASEQERRLLWAGRKGAFGALGRLSPSFYTVDGVVPRSALPEVMDRVGEIGRQFGLRICNVFHAGDGNLHPLILFDDEDPDEVRRTVEAGEAIMRVCAEAGGSLTGEHGIGLEKRELMPLIFTEADLAVMARVKQVLDPAGLCNPGKLFPTPGRCLEVRPRRTAVAGW